MVSDKPAKREGVSPAARRKARHYALQALYQWQISGTNLRDIEQQFRAEYDFKPVDLDYFQALLHEVPAQLSSIEEAFAPQLDRGVQELTPIELTLLRMGTYELQKRPDVPFKVVINEAVSLAKKFGATDSHKYINGVLDKLVPTLRPVEFAGAGGKGRSPHTDGAV